MKRIDTLTDEQRTRMRSWADEWIARGLDTSPVDWTAWEAGARDCYGYVGVPWPGVVVRVPNPLVGSLAAPIASYLIGASCTAVGDAVRGTVRGTVRSPNAPKRD